MHQVVMLSLGIPGQIYSENLSAEMHDPVLPCAVFLRIFSHFLS